MPENNSLYRERAHLVAHLSTVYPSVGCYNDSDEPGWLVVFIETPVGQMSWNIAPDDTDLFEGICIVDKYEWDGHSTDEKYRKLQNFTSLKRLPSQLSQPSISNQSRLDTMLVSYRSKHVAAALRG